MTKSLEPKKCAICFKEFKPKVWKQKYCGPVCNRQSNDQRHADLYQPSANTGLRQCAHCGHDFMALHSKHKYCTKACAGLSKSNGKPRYVKPQGSTHPWKVSASC